VNHVEESRDVVGTPVLVLQVVGVLPNINAEERLAAFLLNMSYRLHQRGLSATDFHLSMSRHEIGNYLGLAVETVSRLFTRFQEEGLLRVDRKHIEFLDTGALEAILGQPVPDSHRARLS